MTTDATFQSTRIFCLKEKTTTQPLAAKATTRLADGSTVSRVKTRPSLTPSAEPKRKRAQITADWTLTSRDSSLTSDWWRRFLQHQTVTWCIRPLVRNFYRVAFRKGKWADVREEKFHLNFETNKWRQVWVTRLPHYQKFNQKNLAETMKRPRGLSQKDNYQSYLFHFF